MDIEIVSATREPAVGFVPGFSKPIFADPLISTQDHVFVRESSTRWMVSSSKQPFVGLRRRTSATGRTIYVVLLLTVVGVLTVLYQFNRRYAPRTHALLDEDTGSRGRDHRRASFVRDMMRHAWMGYETYAWGLDELHPVSCTGKLGVMGGRNGFSGLGASLVDAMSTLHMMGMDQEFDKAKRWVRENMDFSRGGEQHISCTLSGNHWRLSRAPSRPRAFAPSRLRALTPPRSGRSLHAVFETVIRLLGGLISAYDMSGDKALLDIAEDLGDRIVGVFDGERSGIATNQATLPKTLPRALVTEQVLLAEAFSNLIEFGALGIRTGREEFQLKAEAGPRFLHARSDGSALSGEMVARATGRSRGTSTIAAPADSYYEYLLKYWILTGKTDHHWREQWVLSVDEALRDLKIEVGGYTFVGSRRSGGRKTNNLNDVSREVTHLGCYYPGNVALGVISGAVTGEKAASYLDFAKGMMDTCLELYTSTGTGLGADAGEMSMETGEMVVGSSQYFQRPEVVESLFYLWRATHEDRWREMAWEIAQAIERHCRVDCGYTGVRNVSEPFEIEYDDVQQSWFLAETLKYLYLIFEDDSKIDIAQGWVLNTEAHPVRASQPTGLEMDWSSLERSMHPWWMSWTVPHVRRVASLFSRSSSPRA
jgi:mannosyl-oligosaccharide alpha-1,2-mannosidase